MIKDSWTTAFQWGVRDGFNPCALSTILVFLLFVSWFGSTQRRVFPFGLFFILATMRVNYQLLRGQYDRFLIRPGVNDVLHGFTLCLGLVFMVIGVVYFIHWTRGGKARMTSRWLLRLRRPAFLKEPFQENDAGLKREERCEKNAILKWIILAILSSGLATVIAGWGSQWPQSYWVIATYYFLIQGGDFSSGALFAFLYSVSFALPLFTAWLSIILIARRHKTRPFSERSMAYLRISLSAVFLSTGIGLVYLFIKS